jgi:hypothetical protein
MEYITRMIYPKLRALRNVSSKVEIFTYVRVEISPAVCSFIPSSLPAPPPPRVGRMVVSTLRGDI